jgi:hypothetical protein
LRYSEQVRVHWLVVVAIAACGGGSSHVDAECTDGETRECYSGPPGTENVGPCKLGVEICSGGRWPGVCVGDVPPRIDHCNGADDDCNGVIDDGDGVGDECTGTNGCTGAKACTDTGKVRCIAPQKNECDVCDGPAIDNLGDECVNDEGCLGALVCSPDGSLGVCNAPNKNACALCGGPVIEGLGDACMSADSCPGTMICTVDGDAAVCDAPMRNECDACAPPVGAIGVGCSVDHGCVGVTACNGTGDAALCTADTPCTHLVINELTTDSPVCNTDEYIELYNPSTRTVPLAGYAIRYRPASGTNFTRLVAFAADSTAAIQPHGFFLAVSNRSSTGCSNSPAPGGGYPAIAANTVTGDVTYNALDLSATGGQLWLTHVDADPADLTDPIVVDMVGFGTAAVFEGTGAAPAGVIARDAAHADTDDNAADFTVQGARGPQNTISTPEP